VKNLKQESDGGTSMPHSLFKRCVAEMFGTFWLVFGGVGAAVFACNFPKNGIGFVGVALAFGLTVLTMAYAVGHISGCHLNPAVTLGLVAGRRFDAKDLFPYWIAQVLGGVLGAGVIHVIQTGMPGFTPGGFGSNGYGTNSPGGYSMAAVLIAEVVLTGFFMLIIMGSTDQRAAKGFAPIAIGLGLTLIHLVGIPIDNLSVNPARSTATVFFADKSLGLTGQLWLFWVAPLLGALIAGIIYRSLFAEHEVPPVKETPVTYAAKS
jgi:aquaporin Z